MARAKRADGKNAHTVASNKYQAANYDRINILVPKDYKETIVRPAAEKSGLSISAFIIQAVTEKIEREQTPPAPDPGGTETE